MAILEWLVGLGQGDGGEAASLEQCTLGLITLRDVVMHRQAERSACLALVLRCTVHADDALRGKAIRMVVNQLHPLAFAAPEIESFASERLESVLSVDEADAIAVSDDAEETLRRISLYFALCTRADTLLPRLFSVYAASGPAAQPAFHRNMVRRFQACSSGSLMLSFCFCHRLALRARLGPMRLRFCS
jgi:symplekin